jgi:hypothetical protein
VVQSQTRQIVHKTLFQKKPSQKRAGGVTQGVIPEFKLQYCKKRNNKRKEGKKEGKRNHSLKSFIFNCMLVKHLVNWLLGR